MSRWWAAATLLGLALVACSNGIGGQPVALTPGPPAPATVEAAPTTAPASSAPSTPTAQLPAMTTTPQGVAIRNPAAGAATPLVSAATLTTQVTGATGTTAGADGLEPRTATGDYYLGRAEAPVTLEMFGDFQCPACGEFARSIEPPFVAQYVDTGKVRFVWHDYVWIGDESFAAAQAARCAGRQGHFWAYHDTLYAHQRGENLGQFSSDNLEALAAGIGLDPASFHTCLATQPDMAAIQDAVRAGVAAGVDVTPSFLVNGELRVGAPPLNRLSALMEYYLVRASH